ncbi:MAG: tRNA adenosine(34) deaminase TadA [Oscillospiraceae bacterium]
MNNEQDIYFMNLALQEAKKAFNLGEVPVGAVLVKDNHVLSVGYNLRETKKNALAHAEIVAISNACKALGSWRLDGCTIYVTLEPCPMCTGAIINSRITRIVFGTPDAKAGCCGSVANLLAMEFNHRPVLTGGILKEDCANILQDFFRALR